ncbi:exodeoxyribonuclease VII small subunit [Methanosalsum natronophilum]|nr:exodeoxyribonuclease VII small subunit [Methanosalsum natronophilum]MCS3923499.1 exodeoxyribonuclease VII small subunit [Methanosalsum natronophilum]
MSSKESENKVDANDVEMTFEQAMEKLELLVEQLECGQMTLDESLTTFEEGIKLAQRCRKRLDDAERKIEKLIDENGNTEPFEGDLE